MTSRGVPVRLRRIARLAAFVCAASLPGLAPAAAATVVQRYAAPAPRGVTSGVPAHGTLAGTRLYDNTGNPANTYYDAQGGVEAIDDLHLASNGTLDSLVFEYYDPVVGPTFSATANLYANPGGLDLGASPLAGPFVVNGLPRGRRAVSIALPAGLVVGAHAWVGVQFTSPSAGLIINSVPSVGSSHDLYMEQGVFYWFGGEPKANFGLRLVGTPAPVAGVAEPAPPRVTLDPARPSPFRGETSLRYSIDRRGVVRLDVWDVSGRRVRTLVDGVREAGTHAERWSGRDDAGRAVRAGVYFLRLDSASGSATRRLVFAP